MERDRGAVVRPAHARRSAPRPDTRPARQAVAVIAVVSACLLGLLARRGSWLSDDIEFLVHGSRGLWPGELLEPLNDHIAPGLRFVYAVFAETAPLNHDVTIAWRALMQALAVWLMGLLLLRLVDRRGLALAGTFLYAATPVTMPSFMSLSSGVNNLPSHVFGLLVLHSTLDWFDGRRRRALAYGPAALLGSLLFWEKSALILMTAAGLALWRRRDLSRRRWLHAAWPFGLALAIPLAVFGAVYLAQRRPGSGDVPGLINLADLLGHAATSIALPALVGGPWRFTTFGEPFGLADPPVVASVLGGVVLLLLLAACWRFDRRVLFVWGAAAVYWLVTVTLVGYGRFGVFGSALTVHHHYWSDFAIPLILAVVLTLAALPVAARTGRRFLVAAGCCLLAWTAGAAVSVASFAGPWGDNPATSYFTTLRSDLESAGPSVNIWDTSPPTSILIGLSPERRLSSILGMARIPVVVQGPDSEPSVVDDDGHVRPGRLASWAAAEIPKSSGNALCSDVLISRAASITLALDRSPGEGLWFARIDYLASPDHALRVELLDRETGRAIEVPSRTSRWPAGLSTMYLGPARVDPAAVRLTSLDPAENVCVSKVEIGLPVVAR
jgi:hypothetical protein